MNKEKHIVLFDGECNFCNFWVKFIVRKDHKDVFRFASLQSATGQKYLKEYHVNQAIDSIVLIEDDQYFIKSTAAFRILKTLGGIRSVFYVLTIIPAFIRNAVYDLIAKYRYKIFGTTTCELPLNNDYKNKFI